MTRATIPPKRPPRKPRLDITADKLRAVLDYDPATGVFTWRPRAVSSREAWRWNANFADKIAGYAQPDGRRSIVVFGSRCYEPNLAWLHVTGEWPDYPLRHVNGNFSDNRFANLRCVAPLPSRKLPRLNDLTAAEVRELLHYNPDTGLFTWKQRSPIIDRQVGTWNTKWAGKPTGVRLDSGHVALTIFNRRYLAHRIAWLYMKGEWPTDYIDHINGIPHDNRFANLRPATHAQNIYNSVIAGNNAGGVNSSGYRGVRLHRASGLWHAQIGHEGRSISLGYWKTPELGDAAYRTAERLLRGKWVARDRERGNSPLSIAED
jgi:hypothetical protein